MLRQHRICAGLSQQELADRAGLSVRALSDMERGRTSRPYIRSVRLLCEALGLPETSRIELFNALPVNTLPTDEASIHASVSTASATDAPRQLPAPISHFAGRAAELRTLAALLAQIADGSRALMTVAIGGTAGVGKTALAVQFAHQSAEMFPDGQLYLNMRGFDPGPPLKAEDALHGMLTALGVRAEQMPSRLDAMAGMYRSLLAERRVILVLDNVKEEQQVRPLLPGGPGCMVLITSRKRLTGLAATDDADLINLDVLTDPEAYQLLAARLGRPQVDAEPDAIVELAALCARLPLALGIIAARAAARPTFRLGTFAEELRRAECRLDALDNSDSLASIRAVLSWSYLQLRDPVARMFRLLSNHPGPEISVAAAASLSACTAAQARSLMRELTCWHMLAECTPDRFTFHDLLRAYSADLAASLDNGANRGAAERVLDHYLHTAYKAAMLLKPAPDPIQLAPPISGTAPERIADYQQAMAWFRAEHEVLLNMVEQAGASRSDPRGWQLPWALEGFLDLQGHWNELATSQRTALATAQRLGDHAAAAHAQRHIGHACFWLGFANDARGHLSSALVLYKLVGDCISQARVELDLVRVLESADRYNDALDHSNQALSLFRANSHRSGEAYALNAVGWCHAHLGDLPRAVASCQQALSLMLETDDQLGRACISDSLGYIHGQAGENARALACYQNAVHLYRELGDLHSQAKSLIALGDIRKTSGSHAAARIAWEDASAILMRLGHGDLTRTSARLGERNPRLGKPAGRASALSSRAIAGGACTAVSQE